MASLLDPPTPNEVLLDRRLTPAERKALADKALEEERLKQQLQEGRYRWLRACPAVREAVRRSRDRARQRLADKASEEAAAKAANDGAAGRGGGGMGGSRGFEPMFEPAQEKVMWALWNIAPEDSAAQQEFLSRYGASEILYCGTIALVKVGLVEEQLEELESTQVLTDALCPVCPGGNSGARGSHDHQQQQQPGGVGAGAGGSLSVAARDFMPHKLKGKQHDECMAAYLVSADLAHCILPITIAI